MAMLLDVMLTPLAIAAQNDEWALVAHREHNKAAYLALRMITQEIELIPIESLNQCEEIGIRTMKARKLSKFLNDTSAFQACNRRNNQGSQVFSRSWRS